MVQSLKSQLEHALVKRPETYSMEDSREQLMARLNDVTVCYKLIGATESALEY